VFLLRLIYVGKFRFISKAHQICKLMRR